MEALPTSTSCAAKKKNAHWWALRVAYGGLPLRGIRNGSPLTVMSRSGRSITLGAI